MPITVAPASARARANWRWLAGKNGSTKTTFMPGMVTGYVLPMVIAGFVAPYLLDTTTRFVQAAATLPDVQLALITCEPADRLPPGLKDHLAGHWKTASSRCIRAELVAEPLQGGAFFFFFFFFFF